MVLAFYQKPISYTIRYVHRCISNSSYLINYMHHNIYLHKLSKHVWKTTNTCTCNFLLLYFPLLIVYNATYRPNLIKVEIDRLEIDWRHRIKLIYSEKATKFCEVFPLLLTVCTVVNSKGKISQNFVAFSEYMNFKKLVLLHYYS